MTGSFKRILKAVLPPICLEAVRGVVQRYRSHAGFRPEWEYIPQGWAFAGAHPEVAGWNDRSIVETQLAKWPDFMRSVTGPGPLGVSHESSDPAEQDLGQHNIIMSFAYVLALAAHEKKRLSVLDWGGGLGHYYVLARALMPQVEFDYHCKDLPLLCQAGRRLLPEVQFHEEESCLDRTYDLVLASSSLQYSEDWRGMAARLARASDPCLYITRLPMVRTAPSFVALQRPHRYGYHTEYLTWFLNRDELVQHVSRQGLALVREFLMPGRFMMPKAPAVGELGGFLFHAQKREING